MVSTRVLVISQVITNRSGYDGGQIVTMWQYPSGGKGHSGWSWDIVTVCR